MKKDDQQFKKDTIIKKIHTNSDYNWEWIFFVAKFGYSYAEFCTIFLIFNRVTQLEHIFSILFTKDQKTVPTPKSHIEKKKKKKSCRIL